MVNVTNERATASDSVDGEVIRGKGEAAGMAGSAGQGPTGQGPNEPSIARQVGTPEQAIAFLKGRVSVLHTTVHNTAHYSTLDVEKANELMSDIRWLLAYLQGAR